MGIIPAGAYRNMDYVKPHLKVEPSVLQVFVDLMADPQTSGGLLAALPFDEAQTLIRNLHQVSQTGEIIGEVVAKQDHSVIIN